MRTTKRAAVGLAISLSLTAAALAGPQTKEQKKRDQLVAALADARKAAIAAIEDTQTYRDEDHGRSGQAGVDAKVDRVRELFSALQPILDRDAAKIVKLKEPARRAFLETPDAELAPWELLVKRRVLDFEVLKKNDALARPPKGGLAEHAALPTADELEQARLTNEYRMLLGRSALDVDARLVAAARAHSAEMTRLNYFEHDSPVEANRTPSDRCRSAGVTDCAIGENICEGYRSAKDAFDGWYHSAGHHRNMIDADWRGFGVGRDGEHWTQDYAGARTKSVSEARD